MKKFKFVLFVASYALPLQIMFAQVPTDIWKELDDMHFIVAFTFHPAEEGDFEPVLNRSGELLDKAKQLTENIIPQEINTPEVIAKAKVLEQKSKELHQKVKEGNTKNEDLLVTLKAIHDEYHHLEDICREILAKE